MSNVTLSMSTQLHKHVVAKAPAGLKSLAEKAETANRGRGTSATFDATPAKARELKGWLEKQADKLAKSDDSADKDLARRARIVAKKIPDQIKKAEKAAKAESAKSEQEAGQPVAA